MAEYDLMISKSIDYGRNEAVLDFAAFLISQCVVELRLLAAAELSSTLDVLTKIASRDESRTLPSAPNGLKALVEQARMKLSETGNPGSDNSIGMKELRSVSSDPRGTHESVAYMLEQWTFMYEMSRSAHSVPDNVVSVYVSQGHIMMSSEEGRERFIRVALEIIGQAFQLMSSNPEMNAFESIRSVVPVSTTSGLDYRMNLPDVIQGSGGLAGIVDSSSAYAVVDAFSKLISAVLRIESNQTLAEEILYGVLSVVVQSVNRASRISSKGKVSAVDYRLHFRLLSDLLRDLAPRMDEKSEVGLNTNNIQVLGLFANVLYFLQPKQVPGFAFAWVELLAHRHFLPRILTTRHEHGWSVFHKLLISLLSFLAPHLRASTLPDSVRTLYKGALRVLLVLLHDFPEFLCDFHFSLCDEIPTNCIQLRNLVLSAFPRSMRLPDPFLPDLKVDTLPEMSTTPRVLSKYTGSLTFNNIKGVVDSYLKSRTPASISAELIPRLMFTETGTSASSNGGRYNIPAMNALVFYVGQLAISQTQNGSGSPITLTSHMELFRNLASDLDPEGRYYFVNAVANQLRFPNNHTHYFSVLLLYLFADAKKEIVQEQIIRVLMERLIANRPHPWGLLITFIELIKNPRYNFWSHGFVRCVPEIQRLFETVARSCKMDSI
uniref:CCR4-Not complex component Not1 C-terminal domain-containing protein n=1 Tax=Timspurckia oligopyrenoides TaxID=708627 RepID=A0A7S0ZHU4_9RHOD